MRRIDAPRAHLNDGSRGMVACRTITERDYRLLLAVARAAEHGASGRGWQRLQDALDALNAKPRKP